jgi:hypothetical protein
MEKIIKKEMTSKDFINQSKIIYKWIEEVQKAYGVKNVTDSQIISYLAQKELGFHSETES